MEPVPTVSGMTVVLRPPFKRILAYGMSLLEYGPLLMTVLEFIYYTPAAGIASISQLSNPARSCGNRTFNYSTNQSHLLPSPLQIR
jgi:hypothetical protein